MKNTIHNNHVVGQNIEFWRNYRRFTQTELADSLGVTRLTVSNIEKGKTIKKAYIPIISKTLRVPEFVIMSETVYLNLIKKMLKQDTLSDAELFDLCLVGFKHRYRVTQTFLEFLLALLRTKDSEFFEKRRKEADDRKISMKYAKVLQEFLSKHDLTEEETLDFAAFQIRYTQRYNASFLSFLHLVFKSRPSDFLADNSHPG